MVEAVSILFIAAGVALAVWWVVTDQPRRTAGFAAGAMAILAGAVLLLRGQIVEFSVEDLGSIEAAGARASADADAIRDLRASIEAEAKATTSRLSANAAEAKRLAAQTSAALAKTEKSVVALNQAVERRDRERSVDRAAAAAVASFAAREPSTDQLDVVATSLRGSGSHEVTLTTQVDDPEAIELAIRLKEAIEAGGWVVHGVNQTDLSPSVSGLQVLAPVPLPAHVTTLLGALGRAGLQPKGLARQRVDKLEVLVGSKPRAS